MLDRCPSAGRRFSMRRLGASEQIAMEIRRYVVRSDLRPGARIGTEQQLAAEFDVSRPTLREALRLLASSYLVETTMGRNGGVFVAATPNEGMSRNVSESIAGMLAAESTSLAELMEARDFLECPLAALAAQNSTPEVVAALEQAISDQAEHEPGSEPFNAADARFHRTIAEAAGNDLLKAFTSWTLDVLQPSLVDYIGPRVTADEILGQHGAILRAVRRRQPKAAERAMREHIAYLRDVVARIDAGD